MSFTAAITHMVFHHSTTIQGISLVKLLQLILFIIFFDLYLSFYVSKISLNGVITLKNRLTFGNVIAILLDNKKKTYSQYQMISDLFSAFATTTSSDEDLYLDTSIRYSKWCNGARPIPMEIVSAYEEKNLWSQMAEDLKEKILPNLINQTQARSQTQDLIQESSGVIGHAKVNELIDFADDSSFFTAVIRYAILNDHNPDHLSSPDLSDLLLSCRVPFTTREFIGRKKELSETAASLRKNNILFISGIAGIGKSEFVKYFARKNVKKYLNIIYFHYTGSLKKCITELSLSSDTPEMTDIELFESHYSVLQKLYSDSLVIIDNFNVLPKDDVFFKDFISNNFHMIFTTRCCITSFPVLELKELDKEKDLTALFYHYCPASRKDPDTVHSIIDFCSCHTLTVCLAALTLDASGLSPEELLYKLNKDGISTDLNEEVELYKDQTFSNGDMMDHLHKLMRLNTLNDDQLDILRNLCILPLGGVPKSLFKNWMELKTLNDVNYLIRYGFVTYDEEESRIMLHPLLQELISAELLPCVSDCMTLLDNLHAICLFHGIEVRKPEIVIQSLISASEQIIVDMPEYYLIFLQDMFPYLGKYLATNHLAELTERISYTMERYKFTSAYDRCLLLDYKAELSIIAKDYPDALKKRKEALKILEKDIISSASSKSINLLSNIYNNLSNTYLYMDQKLHAIKALKNTFALRTEYSNLLLSDSYSNPQQLITLTNMLILSQNFSQANQILDLYEPLVLEYNTTESLDYGVCKLIRGIIEFMKGNLKKSETFLLAAEQTLSTAVDKDISYLKTTYIYLNHLYSRMRNKTSAMHYKKKLLDSN